MNEIARNNRNDDLTDRSFNNMKKSKMPKNKKKNDKKK